MKNEFFQLILYTIGMVILMTFESVIGLPWISLFFIQQKLLHVSESGFWFVFIFLSFCLGASFAISPLIPISIFSVVWLLQSTGKRGIAFMAYFSGTVLVALVKGISLQWWVIFQAGVSLSLITFMYRGFMWWPLWKKNAQKDSLL